jgi:hypothetical protein
MLPQKYYIMIIIPRQQHFLFYILFYYSLSPKERKNVFKQTQMLKKSLKALDKMPMILYNAEHKPMRKRSNTAESSLQRAADGGIAAEESVRMDFRGQTERLISSRL